MGNIFIWTNPDGTYIMPVFGMKKMDIKQVLELKNQIETYTELGLSQFIQDIPRIMTALKSQGLGVEIDGNQSNSEMQEILMYFYKKLFGKYDEVLPKSVPEMMVKFRSALGNPTNMRNAMQRVLVTNKLIPSIDQPISKNNLENWLRGNEETPSLAGINLT